LSVLLLGVYSPAAGATFDILDWANLTGTFSTLQLPPLAGALTWNTTGLYTNGVLAIDGGAGLPGDYNHDGSVDAADYVVWRKSDGTQDGYNTWRTNFGRTAGGGAMSMAAVPEPATAVLIVLGAAIGCWRTRLTRLARSKTRSA
jgi:hypothetical protein